MKKQEQLPSLEDLERDIKKLNEKVAPKPKASAPPKGAALVMRMGVELISGALVGLGIGYFLDKWLNTSPLFLLVCFFLGSAGGFMTIYRILKVLENDESNESKEDKEGV